MVSVDIVHGLSGHCPWTQWTLSMDLRSNTPAGQCPWTMSTESMEFLETGKDPRFLHTDSKDCGQTGSFCWFCHAAAH